MLSLTLRAVSKDTWPALQWSGDDHTCALAVTNNVHVYSKADNFAGEGMGSVGSMGSSGRGRTMRRHQQAPIHPRFSHRATNLYLSYPLPLRRSLQEVQHQGRVLHRHLPSPCLAPR